MKAHRQELIETHQEKTQNGYMCGKGWTTLWHAYNYLMESRRIDKPVEFSDAQARRVLYLANTYRAITGIDPLTKQDSFIEWCEGRTLN